MHRVLVLEEVPFVAVEYLIEGPHDAREVVTFFGVAIDVPDARRPREEQLENPIGRGAVHDHIVVPRPGPLLPALRRT